MGWCGLAPKGIQGSNTDLLLCAVAERYRIPILTTDDEFLKFGRVLPLRLHAREHEPRRLASRA